MDYIPYCLVCPECGRKILVEVLLNGVSHNTSITATCADCIGYVSEQFKTEHPVEAEQIKTWIAQ